MVACTWRGPGGPPARGVGPARPGAVWGGGAPGGGGGARGGGCEEFDVLGVGARPAALDVGHAVLVEHACDADLVGQRQRDVLALGAVAKGRVVEDDRRICGRG